MSVDLRPAPGAAPLQARIWRHGLTEARLILANGEQALLNLVIPIGLLLAGRFVGPRFGWEMTEVSASVIAVAVWSTTFTALAIQTGFERRYDVLERLAATPLGRSGIVLGKGAAIGMVLLVQLCLLLGLAFALGWRPSFHPAHLAVSAAAITIGGLGFASWALSLAGSVKAETTLALANLIYLAGLLLGLAMPLPDSWGWVHRVVPTAALGEALRHGDPWSLLTLTGWAAAGFFLARKVFRWTS